MNSASVSQVAIACSTKINLSSPAPQPAGFFPLTIMTNDYTQMVSPIWPKTSNERFKPLLALVAAQIPHLIWGYDALVHSNFDYDVACKELQIIIKSKDLEAAVNAIKESDSFYISSPKSMLLAEVPHNRYYFESDCRFLWAPKNSGSTQLDGLF